MQRYVQQRKECIYVIIICWQEIAGHITPEHRVTPKPYRVVVKFMKVQRVLLMPNVWTVQLKRVIISIKLHF